MSTEHGQQEPQIIIITQTSHSRRVLSTALQNLGYNGQRFCPIHLDQIRELGNVLDKERPSIAIMDLEAEEVVTDTTLIGRISYQALRELQEVRPLPAIVALSHPTIKQVTALKEVAVGVLSKPINPACLDSSLTRAFKRLAAIPADVRGPMPEGEPPAAAVG